MLKKTLLRRLVAVGASFVAAAGFATGVGAAIGLSASPAAAATPVCSFKVVASSATTVNVAGGTFIVGAVAGSTKVSVSCNSSSGAADAVEASLAAGVATTGVGATDFADTGTLTTLSASSTNTACPAGSSCVAGIFSVPATFSSPTSGTFPCPVSQTNANEGLEACVIAVVNSGLAPVTEALLAYAGQPTPAAPSIAASISTGVGGDTISVSDASGNTSYWWADAVQAIQAAILGTTPATSASCSPSNFGDVPTQFLSVVWKNASTGATMSGSAAGVSISNDCYNGTTFYPPVLSGTIPVPSTVTPGTTYRVYLCEALGYPGMTSNDATPYADCGKAPLAGATWIDASFSFQVEGAATGSASPSSGGVGTNVAVTVSGLDPQGTAVTAQFENGTNSANAATGATGSTGTCGTVSSSGTVSCSIAVTSADTQGSNPIVIYQSDAGPTTTLKVPFTVTAISTTCSIDTSNNFTSPSSCSIQQVITVTVSGNTTIGLTISESSPNVTLSAITLNGTNQTATGALNTVLVNDSRGTLAGWSVVGQFSGEFQNATPTGNANDNVIDVECSGSAGQVTVNGVCGFNWTPSVTAVTSRSSEITAGGATTTGLSTTTATPFCSAAAGGGGGETDCNAAVTLTIPAWVAAGTYSATLQITVS